MLLEFLSVLLHLKRLELQPKLVVLFLCQGLIAPENLPPVRRQRRVVQVLLELAHVAVMLVELLLLQHYSPRYGPVCTGLEDLSDHGVQEQRKAHPYYQKHTEGHHSLDENHLLLLLEYAV